MWCFSICLNIFPISVVSLSISLSFPVCLWQFWNIIITMKGKFILENEICFVIYLLNQLILTFTTVNWIEASSTAKKKPTKRCIIALSNFRSQNDRQKVLVKSDVNITNFDCSKISVANFSFLFVNIMNFICLQTWKCWTCASGIILLQPRSRHKVWMAIYNVTIQFHFCLCIPRTPVAK